MKEKECSGCGRDPSDYTHGAWHVLWVVVVIGFTFLLTTCQGRALTRRCHYMLDLMDNGTDSIAVVSTFRDCWNELIPR